MKLTTDLIRELEQYVKKYGDLPVYSIDEDGTPLPGATVLVYEADAKRGKTYPKRLVVT
jgi:hypothetical protein